MTDDLSSLGAGWQRFNSGETDRLGDASANARMVSRAHELSSRKFTKHSVNAVLLVPIPELFGRAHRQFVAHVVLEQVGMSDPLEEAKKRRLSDHLDDFEAFLKGKQNTEKHVTQTCNRIKRILAGCGFELWSDISPSQLVTWLSNQRSSGAMGVKTSIDVGNSPRSSSKTTAIDC